MKLFRKFLIYVYIFIIFILSTIPPSISKKIQLNELDKLIHFFEYFILGLIFNFTFKKNITKFHFSIIFVPIIDEFIIQRYSGRNVDIFDFMFDIFGLIVGICFR